MEKKVKNISLLDFFSLSELKELKKHLLDTQIAELLDYFEYNSLACMVFFQKYANLEEGEIHPDDMHMRLAIEFSRVEKKFIEEENKIKKEYKRELKNFLSPYGATRKDFLEDDVFASFHEFGHIIPQGSVMSQLGTRSIGSLSNCLKGDTKVLTRKGYLPISSLNNKNIEIMTKGGGWVTAPFKSYGKQLLYKISLKKGKTFTKELFCTQDHNWFISKNLKPIKTSTIELKMGDSLHLQFGKGRSGFSVSRFGISHGIVFGDGHSVKGINNANNITLCDKSRELGKYFNECYISSDEDLCNGGSDFYGNIPNYYRNIPDIKENKSYLYGWLSGYFAADGHIDKRGSCMINSSKYSDMQFVQDICGVLGIGCGEIGEQTVISNLTNRLHTMYKVFLHAPHLSKNFFLLQQDKSRFKSTNKNMNKWKIVKVEKTELIEEVFCAEVPNTHSFVIEGNILSGNCFVVPSPLDSYGGIFTADQHLGQIMKRRGGCIEENTLVIEKYKGRIPIKEIKIGDQILSYNIITKKDEFKKVLDHYYTNVDLKDQIEFVYEKGVRLKSSSKHPILDISNSGHKFKKKNELTKESYNKTLNLKPFVEDVKFSESDLDIAWLIGFHLGDGTSDKAGYNKNSYRLRVNGDNKECIYNYKRIVEKITNSNSTVKLENTKRYSVDVWKYESTNKNNKKFISLLDGQTNNKTYNWFIPSVINKNNFIPFLAGLIDSDGHVLKSGKIAISVCSKFAIEQIASLLSFYGQSYKVTIKIPKRKNEKIIYNINIHKFGDIYDKIIIHIIHQGKKKRLQNKKHSFHSKGIILTNVELSLIKIIKNNLKIEVYKNYNNLFNSLKYVLKNKKIGVAALTNLLNHGLIKKDLFNTIVSRTRLESIIEDTDKKYNYIDIKVADNSNYYAGEFGFINIHNCGIDISTLRPTGAPTSNVSKTSTGAVSFMDRFSNTTREVAQGGRRGALMISIGIEHPDIEQFIDIKNDLTKVTGANISVRVNSQFIEAVKENKDYCLRWPSDKTPIRGVGMEQNVVYEHAGGYIKWVDAKALWDKLIKSAHKSAEPGILFWTKVLTHSPDGVYHQYKSLSTNPCFPESEYLLTDKGYRSFKELYKSKEKINIIADNRITYENNGKEEKVNNWKININKKGINIKPASEVFLTKKDADIVEICTTSGFKLKCTPDHHIATTKGMVEAKDLTREHNILICKPEKTGQTIVRKDPKTDDEIAALLIGMITGDGTFSKAAKTRSEKVHIDLWGKDAERLKNKICLYIDILYNKYYDYVDKKSNKKLSSYYITIKNDKIRISSIWLSLYLNKKYSFSKINKHKVPEFIFNNPTTTATKFYLAAFVYSDGSVQGTKATGFTIRISQSNEKLLRKLQLIFHSNGIIFGIYLRREKQYRNLPDGKGGLKKYLCKAQFELISLNGGLKVFNEQIGYLKHPEKEGRFNKELKNNNAEDLHFTSKFKAIKFLPGKEDVYCIKEDIGRNIVVNCISTRRCGEIPIPAYDSCRLMALNLLSMVKDPYTPNAKFDKNKFYTIVYEAMRLSDDLVELELEAVTAILFKIKSDPEPSSIKKVEEDLWKNIYRTGKAGRRTGLGFTALADMAAALNLTYGSKDFQIIFKEVMKIKLRAEMDSTIDMSILRGPFEGWDPKAEFTEIEGRLYGMNSFYTMLAEEFPEQAERMYRYGRRNISTSTVAPTGSLSILAQVSSGIEPIFKPYYKRRKKILDTGSQVEADFVDINGDKWTEHFVIHPEFEYWCMINNYNTESENQLEKAFKNSPWKGATANDIHWRDRITTQAIAQKYTTHSISSTVNLPNDVSIEEVNKIYLEAEVAGLKGITVYREGSRDGVLISTKEKTKKTKFAYIDAIKRPKSIDAIAHTTQVGGDKYSVFVGLVDDLPYEVFAYKGGTKEGKGTIIKANQGEYDFLGEGEDSRNRILTGKMTDEQEVVTRFISGSLRHGRDIKFIVGDLNKTSGSLFSFNSAIARVLKLYIPNGTSSKEKCPECGSEGTIFYQEGCKSCVCGYSACN